MAVATMAHSHLTHTSSASNSADTKEYEIMQIFRSDGVDTGPGYWPDTVKKTGSTSAVRKSGMIRLDEMDPRFIEWRLKLGVLIKQELSPTPQDGLSWYVPFPKGYWLYEKSKHFMVSGYPIKGKLFKTPQDFALHLLWLLSSSESRQDCCCVFCNVPSETNDDDASNQKSLDSNMKGSVVSSVAITASNGGSTGDASAQESGAFSGKISTIKSRKQSRAITTSTAAPMVYNPALAAVNPPLFRTGELVWYSHESSWRLGLITISEATWHQITPIGHSSSTSLVKINKAPSSIRPFLAFSVPAVAQEALFHLSFDEIPWADRIRPLQASGAVAAVESLMLDASKLAALKINRSHSFFNRVGTSNGTTSYKGMFLGAERLHVDDVLRVSQTTPIQPGQQAPQVEVMDMTHFLLKGIYTMAASPGTIFFHGDVVKLVNQPTPDTKMMLPETLPPVLFEEASFRNNSTSAATWKWQWAIVLENTWRKEPDVKGRFYSMPRLGPILLPQHMKGARDKVAPALNGRLDTVLGGRNIGEMKTRADTVRDTVSATQATGSIFKFDEREVQFENDV